MRAVKVILFGLLLILLALSRVESDCEFYEILEPGKTYDVFNPGCEDDGEECTWIGMSSYPVQINCDINIPASENCDQDSFSIQFAGEKTRRYCGTGSIHLEGRDMIIKANASCDTSRSYLCKVRVEFDEYNCKCGSKKMTKIVGGVETDVNEYPMMVGLVDVAGYDRSIYCGGTIIHSQYVITAAHCVDKRNVNNLLIVAGEHDVNSGNESNATKIYRVLNYIMHPDYAGIRNDIAVCTIKGKMEFNAAVGPACLPFQHHRDSFGGSIVIALGWGLLDFAGGQSSTLQKVDLNVIGMVECERAYNGSRPEYMPNDENICTYTPGKDTCQMDSGGPVLWHNPTSHNLVLVGITSAGIACASDEPAIDMRTGAFMKWILSVTPDAVYCKVE